MNYPGIYGKSMEITRSVMITRVQLVERCTLMDGKRKLFTRVQGVGVDGKLYEVLLQKEFFSGLFALVVDKSFFTGRVV